MKSPLIKFAQEQRNKMQRILTQHEQLDYELVIALAEAIHEENKMIEKRIMKNIKKEQPNET